MHRVYQYAATQGVAVALVFSIKKKSLSSPGFRHGLLLSYPVMPQRRAETAILVAEHRFVGRTAFPVSVSTEALGGHLTLVEIPKEESGLARMASIIDQHAIVAAVTIFLAIGQRLLARSSRSAGSERPIATQTTVPKIESTTTPKTIRHCANNPFTHDSNHGRKSICHIIKTQKQSIYQSFK